MRNWDACATSTNRWDESDETWFARNQNCKRTPVLTRRRYGSTIPAMRPNGTACVIKLSGFLGVAVLWATLTVSMGALGQQTAQDFLNGGNVKMDKGDRVGAIADFSKAIELDPNFVTAYYRRGDAKIMKGGDLDGSITDYSKAIELDPNFASAYCRRGNARMYKKDWEGATADWSKAIKLNPTSTEPYLSRGITEMNKKDWEGAIADCSKVIELNPTSTVAYFNRGNAKIEKANWMVLLPTSRKTLSSNRKKIFPTLPVGLPRRQKTIWMVPLRTSQQPLNSIRNSLSPTSTVQMPGKIKGIRRERTRTSLKRTNSNITGSFQRQRRACFFPPLAVWESRLHPSPKASLSRKSFQTRPPAQQASSQATSSRRWIQSPCAN